MTTPLYQLKISLLECDAAIWRRVIVRRSQTLRQLHHVIQATMGWKNYHLFAFQANGEYFEEPSPDYPREEAKLAAATRLSWLLKSAGDKMIYVYDFGDGWRHEILLEDLVMPDKHKRTPKCVDGERACPPEDIGGPFSYVKWVELLQGNDELAREDARVILGKNFDPTRFEVALANRRLLRMLARRG